MQTKEVTTVELKSSLDEINNILVTHVQKQFGFKIESVVVDGEGIVTFKGTKSKDMSVAELHQNGSNGSSLASSLYNGKKGKRQYAPRENAGLTKFLREQLKSGDKFFIDKLVEAANTNGYVASQSLVEKYLKQGTMKRDVTEVNEHVFQLTEFFEKSHNKDLVHAQR